MLAVRSPARSRPASRWTALGQPVIRGGPPPFTRTTAAIRSPSRSGGTRRPGTRRRVDGNSPSQAVRSLPALGWTVTRTGALVVVVVPSGPVTRYGLGLQNHGRGRERRRPRTWPGEPWIPRDRHLGGGLGVLPGQRGHRATAYVRPIQSGDRPRGGPAQQHGRHRPCRTAPTTAHAPLRGATKSLLPPRRGVGPVRRRPARAVKLRRPRHPGDRPAAPRAPPSVARRRGCGAAMATGLRPARSSTLSVGAGRGTVEDTSGPAPGDRVRYAVVHPVPRSRRRAPSRAAPGPRTSRPPQPLTDEGADAEVGGGAVGPWPPPPRPAQAATARRRSAATSAQRPGGPSLAMPLSTHPHGDAARLVDRGRRRAAGAARTGRPDPGRRCPSRPPRRRPGRRPRTSPDWAGTSSPASAFCNACARDRAEISVPSSRARSPSTTVSGTAVMRCRSIASCGK
ncbi:hypothetical protein SANTM175S_08725 [Streptomyces antimycoticus]